MAWKTSLRKGESLIIDGKTIIIRLDSNKLAISTVEGKEQASIKKVKNTNE